MTRFHQLRMDIKLQPIKKPESLHVICIVGMKILYSPRLSDSTSKRSLGVSDFLLQRSFGTALKGSNPCTNMQITGFPNVKSHP